MSERVTAEQLVEWNALESRLRKAGPPLAVNNDGWKLFTEAADAIKRSVAEVERLREALQFYADRYGIDL